MVDAVLALPEDTRLMVLAPVVRDRKGEFAELFERHAGAGLCALPVDGADRRGRDVPKLKKAEKHDIDVVIDRLRRRSAGRAAAPGRELRGRAAHRRRPRASRSRCDSRRREHLFSSKFACPLCSYSLSELEPRLFSFNSPVGACPTCDGLGHVTVFDPERVVAFPSLSLASGAVKGWDRRNAYTHSLLESVASHYGFDIDTPFEELPTPARAGAAVRLGRATRSNSSTRPTAPRQERSVKRAHPFEGIIPSFERRLRETDSSAVREELARYQAAEPCPRLRRRAPAPRGAARVPAVAGRRQRARPADLRGRALHAGRSAGLFRQRCSWSAPRPRSPTRSFARSAPG